MLHNLLVSSAMASPPQQKWLQMVTPNGHTVFIEVLVLLHESDSITLDFIGSVQQISDLQAVRSHSQNQLCPVPDTTGLPG
jgi:hypothetical protein